MNHKIKFRHSIFIKLAITLIVTGIIVFAIFIGFYKMLFGTPVHEFIDKNIAKYNRYIVAEIGIPPDTLKAKAFSEEYSVQIRYESSAWSWATSPDVPAIDDIKNKPKRGPDPGWLKHRFQVITNPDGSQYLFVADFGRLFNFQSFIFLSLLLLLFLIFITHYFIVRHILKPIKWLSEGVRQVRDGNLDYQIPVTKTDELGKLTETFNEMIKRVKEMLNARDQLLLDVSHELRSPLTRIKVALEFLPEDKTKNSILSDIAEIETQITEILESERLKDGYGNLNKEKVSLEKLVTSLVSEFEGRNPEIKILSFHEKIHLNIDVERIKIVLRNVIENAIKFSSAKSKLIEISFEKQEKAALIKITDDGTGIPEKDLPYLFEPFYRVDRSRSKETGGYGLGLSLCKKIMEAHNGKIEISNNPQNGTTVKLQFPLT